MKKFISMLVAMLMVIAMLPAATMAEGTAETIFVRCDNITLPENSVGWTYSTAAADYYSMLNDGEANLPGIGTSAGTSGYDSTAYATAQIDVDGHNGEAKTYYIWAAGRSDGARPIYIAFDDSEIFSQSAVAVPTSGGMAWNNYANGFSLTPGSHTLKIRVGAANSSNFQGLIITDDANYAPTEATTYADILALVNATPDPEPAPDPEPEYENVLLGYENFVMPDYNNANSGLCDATTDTNRDKNYLFDKSMWLNNNANTLFTHGRFYVGTSGTYKVWMLSRDDESTDSKPSTTRIPTIGIDTAPMRVGEAHATLSWSCTEWTLDAGWHSIYLGMKNSWSPVKINAIYITNNSDYTPNIYTHSELLAYKFNLTEPRTKWMLTWNNFELPDIPEWEIASNISGLNNWLTNERKYIKMNKTNDSGYAEAKIYVEAEGDYVVWMLYGDTAGNSSRYPKAGFDGEFNNEQYTVSKDLSWNKSGSSSWHLTKGWHTLQLGLGISGWNATYVNAVYITSDLTETVTTESDNALLEAYGGSSVNVGGELYAASGLEKAGLIVKDNNINITPVKANATEGAATVTVNGTDAAWDIAAAVALNKGVNTVAVDSSDDSADCSFKVVSAGTVINHTEAVVTGEWAESAISGVDGKTKAITLSGSSAKAKFSAAGITGKAKVYVYTVPTPIGNDANADVVVSHKNGTADKKPDNSKTVGEWIYLDTYEFSGSTDEYIEISGNDDGKLIYVDSVKFEYADEYLVSAPVMESADGKVKFVYDCYKQTDSTAAPVAIIAEYNGEKMSCASVNALSHSEAGIYTISTNAIDKVDGADYRSFIWESIGNMIPLR